MSIEFEATDQTLRSRKETMCNELETKSDSIDFEGFVDVITNEALKLDQIKDHPFFQGLDWRHLNTREPPFKP